MENNELMTNESDEGLEQIEFPSFAFLEENSEDTSLVAEHKLWLKSIRHEKPSPRIPYHILDRTLRLCVGTWEGDIESLGGNILTGVARILVAYGDKIHDEQFKEKVGFMSIRQLSRTAKERGQGSLGYAEAMLIAYNRKCKYPLRMTKLYTNKKMEDDEPIEELDEEDNEDQPTFVG